MDRLLSPVLPYLTKTTASIQPLVERAIILKAGMEERLPEIVSTGLTTVKDKVKETF